MVEALLQNILEEHVFYETNILILQFKGVLGVKESDKNVIFMTKAHLTL